MIGLQGLHFKEKIEVHSKNFPLIVSPYNLKVLFFMYVAIYLRGKLHWVSVAFYISKPPKAFGLFIVLLIFSHNPSPFHGTFSQIQFIVFPKDPKKVPFSCNDSMDLKNSFLIWICFMHMIMVVFYQLRVFVFSKEIIS